MHCPARFHFDNVSGMDQGLNVGRIKVNWILLLGALHVAAAMQFQSVSMPTIQLTVGFNLQERLSYVRIGGIERPSGTS